MKRREFITLLGGAAAWPLAAGAQQPGQLRRVGVLLGVPENDPETKSRVRAFQLGMRDAGWIDGRNVHIEYRYAGTDPARARRYLGKFQSHRGSASIGDKDNPDCFRCRE